MAGKTATRVVFLAALIGVTVYFAPEVVDEIGTFLGDAVGANDAVVMGEGETALMVAADAKAKVVSCAPEAITIEKSCGGLRILVQGPNRAVACPRSFSRSYGGQCDEYPMASTAEGGAGARTEEVPARENQCQGPTYRSQYPPDGERFLVVISRPDLVAPAPFAGADIAKEQGRC